MDWEQAIAYLDMLIGEYELIGWLGYFGLHMVLYPLKRWIDAGERSEALYKEIMECE